MVIILCSSVSGGKIYEKCIDTCVVVVFHWLERDAKCGSLYLDLAAQCLSVE